MAVAEKANTGAVPQADSEAPQEISTNKQRMLDAAGVVATAVTVALFQSGRLGAAPFSIQIMATVAGLAATPALYRSAQFWKIPSPVRTTLLLAWGTTCFAPCLVALIIELCTGHQRPGAGFFDAMWRVYAIIALWIGFAVANERFIKPWWSRASERWFGHMRGNSIAAQNRQRAMDRRTAALEGIKARVVLALRRKKRAEKMGEKRDADIKDAAADIAEAEQLLEKARTRAQQCETDGADDAQKKEADEKVERMTEMVQTAKLHARQVRADVDRCKSELESVEDELKMLQHEWTTALHIENHVEFAR